MALVPFGGNGATRGPDRSSDHMPRTMKGKKIFEMEATNPLSKKVNPGADVLNNTPQNVRGAPRGNGRRFNP